MKEKDCIQQQQGIQPEDEVSKGFEGMLVNL